MNTTTLHPAPSSTEALHPPSTRPPTPQQPLRPKRRAQRHSWITRLIARLRRPRFEIDPHTARQNELDRIEREAAHTRALSIYGGFR